MGNDTPKKLIQEQSDHCLICSTENLFEDYRNVNIKDKTFLFFKSKLKECKAKGINTFIKIFFYESFNIENVRKKPQNGLEKDYKIKYIKNPQKYNELFDIIVEYQRNYLELLNMLVLNKTIKSSIEKDEVSHISGLIDYMECDIKTFNFDGLRSDIREKLLKTKEDFDNYFPNHNLKIYILMIEDVNYKEVVEEEEDNNMTLDDFLTSMLDFALESYEDDENEEGDSYINSITNVVFQYLYTLNLFTNISFQHNDCHFGNFLIQKKDFKHDIIYESEDGQKFKCKTPIYIGKFIDFGNSCFFNDLKDIMGEKFAKEYNKVKKIALGPLDFIYSDKYRFIDYFTFINTFISNFYQKYSKIANYSEKFRLLLEICKKLYNISINISYYKQQEQEYYIPQLRNEDNSYNQDILNEYKKFEDEVVESIQLYQAHFFDFFKSDFHFEVNDDEME